MTNLLQPGNGAAPTRTVIEVFADIVCPFTHVGLRRFVEQRDALGRDDVVLHVRAWPLEIVNGAPVDPHFIAEEVDDLHRQIAPDLFARFTEAAMPVSSLPALSLAAAAYEQDLVLGEAVSLELRDLLFERGIDVSDPIVLRDVARSFDLRDLGDVGDHRTALADHAEGVERGVIGSPHFFTPGGDFFCPALDITREDSGHLRVHPDIAAFDRFLGACFG